MHFSNPRTHMLVHYDQKQPLLSLRNRQPGLQCFWMLVRPNLAMVQVYVFCALLISVHYESNFRKRWILFNCECRTTVAGRTDLISALNSIQSQYNQDTYRHISRGVRRFKVRRFNFSSIVAGSTLCIHEFQQA